MHKKNELNIQEEETREGTSLIVFFSYKRRDKNGICKKIR